MRALPAIAAGFVALCAARSIGPAAAATVRVGPGRPYAVPSATAVAIRNGDTVEIEGGIYAGDVAVWRASNLTLRGVHGRPHLRAEGRSAENKAIWVIKGTNTTVENIEFSGARVPDRNGAGIRQEGDGLTLRHCLFHDNEDGILTGASPTSEILIEFSEFGPNGAGDGLSHNLYIGRIRRFTMRYCYSHHARVGHTLKSRARENHIYCNRITGESSGTSSYEIDLPDGGLSFLIGNLIQQGPRTENSTLVSYAEESRTNPTQELYAAHNTLVNDRPAGIFFRVAGQAPQTAARIVNNVFVGPGTRLSGVGEQAGNVDLAAGQLLDAARFDYRLAKGSPAIDASVAPGAAHGVDLLPADQYAHPCAREPRPVRGKPDAGAYEWTTAPDGRSE